MLLIVGDTYDYRKEIGSLGGTWRKKYRGWEVYNTEEIRKFMEKHQEFELLVLNTIEKLREREQEVADMKADRLLERAAKRREKAVRCVQIKGDTERRREKEREEAFKKIKIGTKVDYFHTGVVYIVVKINRKTIRIQKDSDPSRSFSVDPRFVKVIE